MEQKAKKQIDDCKIDDYQKIKKAICYLSKRKNDEVDLTHFANSLGLNKRQFTDLFNRWCGLSPKSFMQAVALNHAKKLLEAKKSTLDVSLEVGFSSTSRLHDLFVTYHAMPPGAWANKGKGLEMVWGISASPFGMAILFTTKYGLAGLAFFDEKNTLSTFCHCTPTNWRFFLQKRHFSAASHRHGLRKNG